MSAAPMPGNFAPPSGSDTDKELRLRAVEISRTRFETLAWLACGGGAATPGASGSAAGPGSAAPISGAPERPTGPTEDATLVRVVDGDFGGVGTDREPPGKTGGG